MKFDMADNQEPVAPLSAPTTASVPAASVTPAETTISTPPAPVTSAVSTETASSSVTATPVAEEAAKVEVKTEAPVEGVLGEKPKEPVKVDTAEKKVDGEKPKETKAEAPTEVKTELPVYDAFKLPENIALEKEPLDAFTKILGEIETGKLDHKGMQEKGQALIDLAAKSTIESINRLNDSYVQIHNEAKKSRFESLKSDPDLGGDKLSETISALQKSVSEYGGTEAQISEFRKEVSDAGIDASPALCRLIYNMQQKINSYTTENGANRIVPGAKPAPSKVKDYQRFYQAGNQ